MASIKRATMKIGPMISSATLITPRATETLIEAEIRHLIGDLVEATEPSLERMRIVQTETVELGDLQPGLAALLAQSLRRQQHAAGKDVGLDEVRPPAIGLEELVGDDDGLHQRRSARRPGALQHGEIVGPLASPTGPNNLDRHAVDVAACTCA